MNSRYGAAPTNTPPKPTSIPLTRFRPSAKTLRLSSVPSPSVSSKIRMRSLPFALRRANRVGVRLGDPEPAAVVDRERDRPDDVGLGGRELHGEALRQRHRLGRFDAREPGMDDRIHRRHQRHVRRGELVRKERLGVVEAEAIEVDVRPRVFLDVGRGRRAGLLVDDADEDVPAGVGPQIDDRRTQARAVGAADRVDDLLIVGQHQLDARALECAARDQEAGVRLRHPERRRRQRPLSARCPSRRCSPSRCPTDRGSTLLLSAPPSGRPSPLTRSNASPVAVQLSSVPVSKSRFSARPPASGVVPFGRRPRVGDFEPAFHAGGAVPGQRTEIGVGRGGLERDVRGRALVEDLRALDLALVERDVVHHQLAVDDGDADGLAGAGPQRRDCGCRRSRRRCRGSRAWTTRGGIRDPAGRRPRAADA